MATAAVATDTSSTETRLFKIVDDAALTSRVVAARQRFLAAEPRWQKGKENRLDVTVLVQQPDGSWLRGSHGPEELAYPASCVKLPYMAAAMQWCRENGKPYEALDKSVRPMITVSSNEATGEVVDAITSAPNIESITTSTDPAFAPWLEKRLYTERFLESRGLLGNQTIYQKTYPSNSGETPTGAEKVVVAVRGGNKMQPRLSASLMLEITEGAIEPKALPYMRELLTHARFEDDSILGWGLPPGTVYLNKPGVAYDTVEDIAAIRLPNGQKLIVAVFTNSLERGAPLPHDANRIGKFADILLDELDLRKGCPPSVGVAGPGITSRTLTVALPITEPGLYELVGEYPKFGDATTTAVVTVASGGVETTRALNQRVGATRRVYLGNHMLAAGSSQVTISSLVQTTASVALTTLTATRWPNEKVMTVARCAPESETTSTLKVQIVAPASGTPIENAEVQVRWGNGKVRSGTTDVSGIALVRQKAGDSGKPQIVGVEHQPHGWDGRIGGKTP